MADFIYDTRGPIPKAVAWIENGDVFTGPNKLKIGTVRHGAVYSLDGTFAGNLAHPGPGSEFSEEFAALLP